MAIKAKSNLVAFFICSHRKSECYISLASHLHIPVHTLAKLIFTVRVEP